MPAVPESAILYEVYYMMILTVDALLAPSFCGMADARDAARMISKMIIEGLIANRLKINGRE